MDYILKVVDADDPTIVTYQHWALIDGEMVMIGGEKTELPTDHLAYEVVDALPDVADAVEGKLYVLRVVDAVAGTTTYQEYKLLDGALVMSSADLSNVQTKLTGLENQYVGFDVDGNAVAIDLPTGHLVREVVDALPLVDDASEEVIYILKVVDPDDASVTYEQWQLIDGAFAQVGGAPVELPENHLTREVVDALPTVDDASETVVYLLKKTDPDTGDVLGYEEWQFVEGVFVNTFAPIELPENHLTREIVTALPAVDVASETVVYMLEKTDPDTGAVIGYEEWVLVNGEFVNTYAAIELPVNHLVREVVDVLPDPADALETVLYVLKVEDLDAGTVSYSEWQLIDGAMVQVSSVDLSGYQTKLTGNAGQMIVIDADGNAVAQDFPEGMLTREVVDVLPDVADAQENVTYILKNDDGAGTITYSEWQLIDGELVQVGGEVTDMSAYQLKLTGLENQYVGFDVDGKAVALDLPTNHLTREVVDALPAEADASETVIYVLKMTDPDTGDVTGYQEWVLVDGVFVQTSGAAVDLTGYQEKLVGLEGQHVVFDADGKAVAADMPTGHLTREVVDALPAETDASEEVIYILKIEDIDAGVITYEEYIFVDGAFVKTSNEATDLSGKQDLLVGLENQYVGFDADGKAIAIDLPVGHLTREVVDALPAVDVASESVVYILKTVDAVDGTVTYEEYILVDGAFVKTSNEATDLTDYQKKIIGTEGQHVVFDAAGELVAADMPVGHLKREVVDALPGVDMAAEDVIYILKVADPDTAAVTYEEWVLIDGAFVQTAGAPADLSSKQDLLVGTETQFVGFDVDGKAVAKEISEIVDEAKAYTDEQINLAAHLRREIVTVDPTTLADTNEHTIYMLKVDGADGADVYQEWMLIDGVMTLIGDTSTTIDLSGKQDLLVGVEGQYVGFDVDGKAVALDMPVGHMTREIVDVLPLAADAKEDVIYLLKVDDGLGNISYEHYQLIDGEVKAIGAQIDLSGYQEKLVGTEGQLVSFDADGKAVAIDAPTDHLVMEVVETLPAVDVAEAHKMYVLKTTDPDTAEVSYEQYQLIDGALMLVGHEMPDMELYQEKLVGNPGQLVGFDPDGNVVAMDVAGAVMDDVPTENSVNAVTSGGLYTAFAEKQDLLVGTEGQIVSFDENGEAVAVDYQNGSVGLVANSQTFKIDITKENASWYGYLKLTYMYGNQTYEATIGLSSSAACYVNAKANNISKVTMTQNGANYTFGITMAGTVYGTHVVEMPTEFGKINSFTNDAFTGDTEVAITAINESKPLYTSLTQLGLTADATIDDVLSAMSAGEGYISDTGAFTNSQTLFPYDDANDAYATIVIIKGSSASRHYVHWHRKDSLKAAYVKFDGNGKVESWVHIGTIIDGYATSQTTYSSQKVKDLLADNKGKFYTSLSQLGLTAAATIDDVLAAMTEGEGLLTDTSNFTNWKTMFPYHEAMDQYSYVLIIKSHNSVRNMVRWVRKDGYAEAIGSFDNTNKIVGWQMTHRYLYDGNMNDGTICLTGSPDSRMSNGEPLSAYGLSNDVMTWPNGTYRFSHFTDLTNTPDNMQNGRLEHFNIKRWGGDANPATVTWAERMSIFYASGGNVYTRYIASGATAGVYTADTGWRALGYQDGLGLDMTYKDSDTMNVQLTHYGFYKFGSPTKGAPADGPGDYVLLNIPWQTSNGSTTDSNMTYATQLLFSPRMAGRHWERRVWGYNTNYVYAEGDYSVFSEWKQHTYINDSASSDYTVYSSKKINDTFATLTGSQALTNKTYNGYTLGAACAKGVATTVASGNTDLVTSGAVYSAIGAVPKFKLSGTTLTITTT